MALPLSVLATDSAGDVAHLIETALTPVFLLSGVGTLLNLFNTRSARVSDQIEKATDLLDDELNKSGRKNLNKHIRRLRYRIMVLDVSIMFGGIAGAATCGAAFVLFLGSVRDASIALWLVGLFGAALLATVAALAAFIGDCFLSWTSLRTDGPLPKSVRQSAKNI
ncbi:DUF2721 domain-containing protein [Acetobacter oeni]|uniref:DUF2721 domain-containing protein n=1 Tax=Acetobacter oeni TaxID=304077 RepID=A0A511XQ09_9PROT|nr:DUF2721 domain-containing protein [Acetobacter oeni]MBB3884722.1 hypothetical protein [Acetobacter oeni]NHO20646.1 DUF2721 domain-containing protein [Acetobacter oeni]GBR04750.1 hypothetical protein AA21952_1516 [Acetobacter oeni LMG 21952]GEN65050.1 hypothetical protein AOE01nite_32740 [Acetobacter oeni]